MSTGSTTDAAVARDAAARFTEVHDRIRDQVARMMVGQEEVVEGVLTALFAGGHVLLEGVPGAGQDHARSRARRSAVDLQFSRIQFTPDMMPADIQGTSRAGRGTKGGGHGAALPGGAARRQPRARRRDQSRDAEDPVGAARGDAGEVRSRWAQRTIRSSVEPFCVMATQNPIEQEGTYPLPEAQLDRFLLKLDRRLSGQGGRLRARSCDRTTTSEEVEDRSPSRSGAEIVKMRATVRALGARARARRRRYAIQSGDRDAARLARTRRRSVDRERLAGLEPARRAGVSSWRARCTRSSPAASR